MDMMDRFKGTISGNDYDNWKTSPPEPTQVDVCAFDECGGEIYEGDEVYRIGDSEDLVHEECFGAYAKQELNAQLIRAAEQGREE